MDTIKTLTDRLRSEQLSQINSRHDAAINGYDSSLRKGEEDYLQKTREAYLKAMQGLRDLPQQLAAKGLWGGILKSEARAIEKDYQNTLSVLGKERQRQDDSHTASVARQNEIRREDIAEFNLKNALADLKANTKTSGTSSQSAKSSKSAQPIPAVPDSVTEPVGEDTGGDDIYITDAESLFRFITAVNSLNGVRSAPSGNYHAMKGGY